jgi:tetratricopeptide (TPR) repeat protein
MSDLSEQYSTLAGAIEEIGNTHHRAGKLRQAGIVLGVGSALAMMPEMPAPHGVRLSLAYGRHLAQAAFQTNAGYEQATETLLAARQRALALGDAPRAAEARHLLGLTGYNCALHGGTATYEEARAYFEEALREREACGDRCGAADSCFYLGLIDERLGEASGGMEAARDWYNRAHQVATENGCALVLSYTHRHLGSLDEDHGNLEDAFAHFQQSLRLREELGYQVLLPLAHLAVGEVLLARGDLQAAAEHDVRALELAREQEAPLSLVCALLEVGGILQSRGDVDQARAYYQEALAITQSNSLVVDQHQVEARLAELDGEQG